MNASWYAAIATVSIRIRQIRRVANTIVYIDGFNLDYGALKRTPP